MNSAETVLSQYLAKAGQLMYRDQIAHHIREQGTAQLLQRATNTTGMLAQAAPEIGERLTSEIEHYIDVTNVRYGADSEFWRIATCEGALWSILETATEVLPITSRFPRVQAALEPRNQFLAYLLYQIPTLSFAYSASTQRAQRKFMGIRKGLFG